MKIIPEKAKRIHGLMVENELAVLCRLAWGSQSIVELGCFKGKSLAAMGLSNKDAVLYGVDFFGDMSHRNYKGSTLEETKTNLEAAGVSAKFYVGKTDEVVEDFEHTVDMLHIDAGHSYDECMNDLKNWVPKVRKGGVVCIHDYGMPHKEILERPEVMQAVDDWRNSEFEEIELDGTMIAFRHIIAEEGILFVAYGDKAKDQVLENIKNLRKITPLPIAIISDNIFESANHTVLHKEVDTGARAQKTRIYSLSPFRKTLFLDADTEVRMDPSFGFKLLDKVDLVIGQDVNRRLFGINWPNLNQIELKETKSDIGIDVMYFNTGVMFFTRSERNRKLFQTWNREWEKFGAQDQLAFIRALNKHPVRISIMRDRFNTHHEKNVTFVYHKHRTVSRAGAPK